MVLMQPIAIGLVGWTLRSRPRWARLVATGFALFTLVVAVRLNPSHRPVSDFDRALQAFVFSQSLNVPGATLFALLTWSRSKKMDT